jgi:elongation factor Tu
MAADRIFISYRRDDSAGFAGRVYDRLNQRFPGQVFRDVDSMAPGIRYNNVLDQTMRSCDVGVVVIGQRWLERATDGTRRLDRANDPVRKEVATLLGLDVQIIPVLVSGASIPDPADLPADLIQITEWNALRIDDDDFDHDSARLIAALERLLADRRVRSGVQPAVQVSAEPATPVILSQSARETNPDLAQILGSTEEIDESAFLLAIEDVFTITGRGPVVTGTVQRGTVRLGDEVEIVGLRPTQKAVVKGIEMKRKLLDEARAEDAVGVLLAGVTADDLERGQVLAQPGSIAAHRVFAMQACMLAIEKGGPRTPIRQHDSVEFYFRAVGVTAPVDLDAVEQLAAGEVGVIAARLPRAVAMAPGLRVAIRQNGETIGVGRILAVDDLPS